MVDHEFKRRRGDAYSVAETLESVPDGALVKMFSLGAGASGRKSAVYACGCVAVEPAASTSGRLQVLHCPTHAALQAKLRRRQTDRH
jgi:hypothetical protein